MIDPKTYSLEHIRELQRRTQSDPQLIERSLHALGLFEALVSVGMRRANDYMNRKPVEMLRIYDKIVTYETGEY